MNSHKIFWLESFSEEKATVKQKWNNPNEIYFTENDFQTFDRSILPKNSIVTIRTHSRIPPSDPPPEISCLITRSTGFDHLMKFRKKNPDFPLAYLPDYATTAVAEHNLSVCLSLLRKISTAQESMKQFDRNDLTGSELKNRNVGIVGVGRIGKATAEKMDCLGASVSGYDTDRDTQWAESINFEYVELPRLFETSEIILLCLPLNTESRELITRNMLFSMPENSFLVNCGRGEVVKSNALLKALDDGPLNGIALDVFENEEQLESTLSDSDSTPNSEHTEANLNLLNHPNTLCTPHNAFNTKESLERKVSDTLENIRHFRKTSSVQTPIPLD